MLPYTEQQHIRNNNKNSIYKADITIESETYSQNIDRLLLFKQSRVILFNLMSKRALCAWVKKSSLKKKTKLSFPIINIKW